MVGYPSDSLASCLLIHPCDRWTDGLIDWLSMVQRLPPFLGRRFTDGWMDRRTVVTFCGFFPVN